MARLHVTSPNTGAAASSQRPHPLRQVPAAAGFPLPVRSRFGCEPRSAGWGGAGEGLGRGWAPAQAAAPALADQSSHDSAAAVAAAGAAPATLARRAGSVPLAQESSAAGGAGPAAARAPGRSQSARRLPARPACPCRSVAEVWWGAAAQSARGRGSAPCSTRLREPHGAPQRPGYPCVRRSLHATRRAAPRPRRRLLLAPLPPGAGVICSPE